MALRLVGKDDSKTAPASLPDAGVRMYGLPNCDTCRKAQAWLQRHAIEFNFIDYRTQPIAAERLRVWARQLGGWERLINRASTTWRQLPDARKTPGSDAEWLVLLRDHPALIKRPVLMTADDAVSVGFKDALFAARLGVAAK